MFFVFLGAFFAILGNFIKTIKPNHFIGIHTPWTLESDYTWEKTHQLSGPIWVVGGIMIAILPFVFPHKAVSPIIILGMLTVMILVPVVYSYFVYRNKDEEV